MALVVYLIGISKVDWYRPPPPQWWRSSLTRNIFIITIHDENYLLINSFIKLRACADIYDFYEQLFLTYNANFIRTKHLVLFKFSHVIFCSFWVFTNFENICFLPPTETVLIKITFTRKKDMINNLSVKHYLLINQNNAGLLELSENCAFAYLSQSECD